MATSSGSIQQRFSIPVGDVSRSRASSEVSASGSLRADLRASGSTPPATAPATTAIAAVPHQPTAAELRPSTMDLGGKGRSFDAVKNKLREILFGAPAERAGGAHQASRVNAIQAQPNAGAISITNAKGHRLDGHFFSPASSGLKGAPDLSKPVVLLLTGSGGSAEEQGHDIARSYSKRGAQGGHDVNVMSVNYRGYGTSQGRPTEKGIYQDAQAMYGELLNMGFKPDQIVVHGFSMGAAAAAKLHAACDANGVQLKGVVYDRPMTSAKEAGSAHSGGGKMGAIAGAMAKYGVGKLDTVGTVTGLAHKNTPVTVTYDNEVLGPNAQAFGNSLTGPGGHGFADAQTISTAGGHMNSSAAMHSMQTRLAAVLS